MCWPAAQSLTGDVTVETPRIKAIRKVIPRDEAERMRVTAATMEPAVTAELNPLTFRTPMEPPPPTPEDNVSDYEQIVRTLKVVHGISPVTADLGLLRELPMQARSDGWKITASLMLEKICGIWSWGFFAFLQLFFRTCRGAADSRGGGHRNDFAMGRA